MINKYHNFTILHSHGYFTVMQIHCYYSDVCFLLLFTIADSMREVSCARNTPFMGSPFLQSILDGLQYFGLLQPLRLH